MRWSRALALLAAAAAAVAWLGCPRSGPRSVREGMAAARPVPLAPGAGPADARPLVGRVDGALDADRGREQWWSLALPDGDGRLDVSLTHEGADDSVTFQVLDADGELRATAPLLPRAVGDVSRYDTVEVVLVNVPGPLYVRAYAVAEGAPRAYRLSARFTPARVPVDAGPLCDPKAIDPANPACEGVLPWCDPNAPDFENPNCCRLYQCDGAGCPGQVDLWVDEQGAVHGTLHLGSSFGIVVGVSGALSVKVRGEEASRRGGRLYVETVDESSSAIWVKLPAGVRLADVEWASAAIEEPVECFMRRRAAD